MAACAAAASPPRSPAGDGAVAPSQDAVQVAPHGSMESDDMGEEKEPKDDIALPGCKLMSIICSVGAIEGADQVLLPSVFFALQRDLGLSLNNLALMSLVQALAGNLAAPFWGVMADRGIAKRRTIIVFGCILQGLITVALAFVDQMLPMVILRGFNGIMLASLRPIASGIVADVTSENYRGRVFGTLQFAMNVGTMAGTLIGTNLGRHTVGGLQGWRVAFLLMGGASVLVGAVAGIVMTEPPRLCARSGTVARSGALKAEAQKLLSYFKMPSFCVLILQGCFGSIPWSALGYSTLFFQIGGLNDLQASLLQVISQISGSLGALLGGIVSDRLTRCSRLHGRPLTAQISVLAGIPVAWFIFMQSPPRVGAFYYYAALMILLGLTATWCGIGVNLPILSELVKPGNRATIMAWEGTLEGTSSAVFGNAAVGFLAQNVFGYDLANAKDVQQDHTNVHALGSALMWVSFCPWIICFLAYSLLHWSYPRDLRRVQEQRDDSDGNKDLS